MGIEIIYSDADVVVVNKPSGLLSVPGLGPEKTDCVVKRLQAAFSTVRVVHRLDCHTSGVMILALTAEAHRELSRQFHDRETKKRYLATVFGEVQDVSGEVTLPLITDWPNRPKQIVSKEGKPAHTRWRRLSTDGEVSTVALHPITGRTHQLRVHMASMGHPILGDKLYSTGIALERSERLLLHAELLSISHPETGVEMTFTAECPF